MADDNSTAIVVCIYAAQESAVAVASELKSTGIRPTDISILKLEEDWQDTEPAKQEMVPKLALSGAVAGSIIGTLLVWLVGLGAIPVPGLGPAIAAEPMLASIAGFGGGCALGAITGMLVENKAEPHTGEGWGRNNNKVVLLSVRCYDPVSATKAREILECAKAEEFARAQMVHKNLERAA